ncbi:MAG: exosortase F system-associated membrane protein [Flavobacterium sp.]
MPKIIENKFFTYFAIFILIVLIAMVRLQEHNLFYDPFLMYFKGIFHNKPLPNYNVFLLIFNYLLRYSINTFLSISIIYLLFRDVKKLKFILYLYILLFVILLIFLLIILYLNNPDYNFPLFYVRRFIIQPVFLILFVPALYFQKNLK